MIKISVEGLDKLQKTLGDSVPKLREEIKNAIKKSIALIHIGAVRNIDRMTQTHSGFLKTRWQISLYPTKAELYPTVNYAPYVHEGTKAHIILPVVKRALFWRGAKHPVKRVHHPGTMARPFLAEAVKSSIEKVKEIFLEAIKKVI